MIKKLFLLFLLFPAITTYPQPQNINISQGHVFDGEPFLLINPQNPNHIIIAWMGYKYNNNIVIKYKISEDYGTSWSNAYYIPHTHTGYTSADVSMDYDNNGNLYLSFIDYSSSLDSGSVYVCKSTDGGYTWSTPKKVINMYDDNGENPIDRPWISINKTDNSIYIVTLPIAENPIPNRPYVSICNDFDNSNFSWKYLDGNNYETGNLISRPMAHIISAENITCAIYPSYLPSEYPYPRYILAYKTTQDSSFSYSPICSLSNPPNDSLAKLGATILINPQNSDQIGCIIYAKPYGDIDIFYTETIDGGTSWSSLLRVNYDPVGNGIMQDMAWGCINETGDVAIIWRDRRHANISGYMTGYEIYAATKKYGNDYFSQNHIISNTTLPYDSILNSNGNDFLSTKFIGDSIYATWGDVRNGKMNIYFTKINTISWNNNSTILISKAPLFYPNPISSNTINIKDYFLYRNKKLYIIDINGKIIFSTKINSPKIKLPHIKAGSYMIKIENRNISKLIVN